VVIAIARRQALDHRLRAQQLDRDSGTVAGTWQARKAGSAVTVSVELWSPASPAVRTAIGEQAERLAAFRRLRLSGVQVTD
jgi:hypothetical protein